ncbi:MAG TPA: transglutaminaseTgpA domain-containing protein [Anaerolineales bacterium]|nr:transglutaminaseTgpA domain-containing protein [Anaerolineales bacterium]
MEKSSVQAWDWLSAALVFFMLQVTAGRLVIANWAPYLYFAETLTAFGTMLGLALGTSRFKGYLVTWLAIDYTLMILPWQWTVIAQSDVPINFRDQLQIIASRLAVALTQFVQRTPVNDSFFFVAFVSLAMWLISLTSGYWLMRHDNLLASVIPSAIVMIIVQVYDNQFVLRAWWLAIYLFLILILVGRRYFLHSRIHWKKKHIAVSEDAWADILNGLTLITLTVVIIAWIVPTPLSSLQAVSGAWNDLSNPIRTRLSNAVVSLQSPYSNGGPDFYSDRLPLGLNAAQGNQPVFNVEVISSPVSITYYWRGRVYDFYSNGQWSNVGASSLDFEPANGNLDLANAQNRVSAQFQFTMRLPEQSLLYAPSEPVWMDQPGSVSVTSITAGQDDPIAWFADPPIGRGGRYQVRAEIADPAVEELDAAGTDYPAWVRDRYLEVPQGIRPAIQTLAEKVTDGRSTSYDKAEAVTEYLRSTIQYSLTVPPPPPGEDPALWVLFDVKKGFCNYYASAEVLMLRSIGIPARLAVGFAEGEINNELPGQHANSESFTVLNHDAHAWPEVYFPGIGWVEFEPTVNQNPIVRPLTKAQIATQPKNQAPSNANSGRPGENPSGKSNTASGGPAVYAPFADMVLIAFSLLGIGLMIIAFRRYHVLDHVPVYLSSGLARVGVSTPSWINSWIQWNQMTSVEHSFAAINASLRWLGSPQPIYATAAERAAQLIKLLPSAREYIEAVTSEHQSALFTRRPVDFGRARRAGLLIVVHTLRLTIRRFWNAISGGDVYSGN